MEIDLKQMVLIGNTLAEEKNIPPETVHDIIEQAVAAAWRRDYGHRDQNVRSTINVHRGNVDIYVIYDVVDEVVDSHTQLNLEEAQLLREDATVGQTVEQHHTITNLGRVAAQTAKQVILQKLREAEREIVLKEFEERVDSLMVSIVTRVDTRVIHLEIGRARGIMPASEQIQGEHYYIGQRVKVLVKTIERDGREPQLILSRGSTRFLELLFHNEVPEIDNGAVVIKGIAREPGVRSKVAVTSTVPNVDPVGTFVGGHGSRIKSVNSEVGDQEKIDIIVWDGDPRQYIINALNPTEIKRAELSSAADGNLPRAKVYVNEDQLNVAIGRNGQNVRLAGRLTGHDIDIATEEAKAKKPTKPTSSGRLTHKEKMEESLLETIEAATEATADDTDKADETDEKTDEVDDTDETSKVDEKTDDTDKADETDEKTDEVDDTDETSKVDEKTDDTDKADETDEKTDEVDDTDETSKVDTDSPEVDEKADEVESDNTDDTDEKADEADDTDEVDEVEADDTDEKTDDTDSPDETPPGPDQTDQPDKQG